MSNHTPGPWAFSQSTQYGDARFYIAQADGAPYTPHYSDVATLIAETVNDERKSIQEANACLIAAAPDLLEACQTFAEWLRREDAGFDHKTHNRETPEGEAAWRKWFYGNIAICDLAQEQALAAIAKATGEK
jgi:hypothetical protein